MIELLILTVALSALIVFMLGIIPSTKLYQWLITAERRAANLKVRKMNIRDGQIEYLEGGQGEVLILLHGFGADKDAWNRMAKHLTPRFYVITIDLPGFGNSFKDMHLNYDVQMQVRWLHEIVGRLNLSQFHLAGNSMGGYIAANYAAINPREISSLWLINTLGVAAAPDSEMFKDIAQKKRPTVLTNSKLEYKQLISRVFHKAPYMPNFLVDALTLNAINNFSTNKKIFYDIHHTVKHQVNFSSPVDLALTGFDRPTLITWGERDSILHPEGAHVLHKTIPTSTVQIIKNVGHVPMIEAPQITAKQFIDFSNGTVVNRPN
jgi:pimeloyl-ACP methyl ester carboxylesterase